MRFILALLIVGCGTTVSQVPLVHDIQVEDCQLVWVVEHTEAAAVVFGGPGRTDHTSVANCSTHAEVRQ